MKESFSQRTGIKKTKLEQIDSMDNDLKTAIWNAIYKVVIKDYLSRSFKNMNDFAISIWTNFYKRTIDNAPYVSTYQSWNQFVSQFKKDFFSLEWHQVYDLMEYLMNDIHLTLEHQEDFTKECNVALQKDLSAYRFIANRIAPITSDAEIEEINEALAALSSYTDHLNKSLELLANKTSPDYKNSIKESISAVEAVCKLISGDNKATLGSALKKLENKIGSLHPALVEAFTKLYGYTSDAKGIRHGHLGNSHVDLAEAKFMFIACSAFVNYLLANAE